MVKRDMFYFADIDEKFIDSTKDNEGLEDGVLVHCQQCIEKNLKAIIQKKYGVISKEHNLVKLLEVLYLQGYPELKKYKSYASDDYEILTHEEYIDYINNFYELLNKLKKIRSEFE